MLTVSPILIQLITAVACLLAWNKRRIQRPISLIGSVLALIAAVMLTGTVLQDGIQIHEMASWPAPFGIVIVADLFSAIMVLVTAFMGLMVAVYSIVDIDAAQETLGYHILYHFLLLGVTGSFMTGDLFNMFVWFEIMLLSSFVLLSLLGGRPQIEGAIKYVILNMFASALFLSSIGLLYGLTGTVNMADLSQQLGGLGPENQPLIVALAMMFTIAFGIKAAIFPLFGWLPASYHTPPTAVSTIFGALLTKVGVYALIRVYTLIFNQPETIAFAQNVLLIIAGFTMVVGVFGAVSQFDIRRLLSFHIISQIGYLIMGLAIFTVNSLAATIFFLVHVILAKSALFMVSGILEKMTGTFQLKKMGGLYKTHLAVSMLFFIPAMALAGIPPLSGFWAKFGLVFGGLEAEQYWIVGVSLFVGILTLYSMIKIWTYAFWRKRPEAYDTPIQTLSTTEAWARWAPTLTITLVTVVMGVAAGPLFDISYAAAEQLIAPQAYITAVLGGTP